MLFKNYKRYKVLKVIKAMHLHILDIFTAYVIIGESRKSCLLNKAKARKECCALISLDKIKAMVIMYNNHYTVKVSSKIFMAH